MRLPINNNAVSISDEIIMMLDAVAAKACKPECECSKNEGSMCDDRARALKACMDVVRHIQSGTRPDISDFTHQELSALVLSTAKMRKAESPKVRRLDILLRNGSARAVRLVRLWTADKLSFDQMFEAVRT